MVGADVNGLDLLRYDIRPFHTIADVRDSHIVDSHLEANRISLRRRSRARSSSSRQQTEWLFMPSDGTARTAKANIEFLRFCTINHLPSKIENAAI